MHAARQKHENTNTNSNTQGNNYKHITSAQQNNPSTAGYINTRYNININNEAQSTKHISSICNIKPSKYYQPIHTTPKTSKL